MKNSNQPLPDDLSVFDYPFASVFDQPRCAEEWEPYVLTEEHFVSWLGVAPNTKVSGGRTISSEIPKKQNRAGQLFRMIAYAIQRSDHWLAAFYRRIRAKGGPKKAIVATARKLAIIFY